MSYKYCIVPLCKNTTVRTPEKLFFGVPRNAKDRKIWCSMMKRNVKIPLSSKSNLYCCEDHFDVENDMANYIKYKLCEGKTQLKLKPGVVPHKFPWTTPDTKRAVIEKRERAERKELVNKLLSGEIPAAEGTIEEIFIVDPVQEQDKEQKEPDPLVTEESDEEAKRQEINPKTHSKKVQVCITPIVHHKSTMTEAKYLAPPRKRKLKPKKKK